MNSLIARDGDQGQCSHGGRRKSVAALLLAALLLAALLLAALLLAALLLAAPLYSTARAQPPSSAPPNPPIDHAARELPFKLHLLGQSLLTHHAMARTLPPPRDRSGMPDSPGLSWRVHLLPFLGENELYEEFNFDEPWDGPHNRTLLGRMPEVFRLDGTDGQMTRFRVFAGPNLLFGSKLDLNNASDGRPHTILVMVAPADLATPWTKPDELPNSDDPTRYPPGFTGGELNCCMADGRLLTLPANTPPEILVALVTPSGHETVDAEALRRRSERPTVVRQPGGETANAVLERRDSGQKMKRIVLAMHNFHDRRRSFPVAGPASYFQSDGTPKLSWRVHILPHLEQDPLYERFHLDEPWDSPHNRELLSLMPEVFRSYDASPDETTTQFVTLVGDFAPFKPKKAPLIRDFRDGTSSTILVVQVGKDRAVPWTQPEDPYFDPVQPLSCLGTLDGNGFGVGFADGAIRHFRPSISPSLFSALVTPSGKEVIDPAELNAAQWPLGF